MKSPFLILGLPRSGTAWASSLFTVGPAFCFHELSREFETAPEIAGQMFATPATLVGNSDSGAVLLFRSLVPRLPGARMIYIRRPKLEARAAFVKVSGLPEKLCAGPFDTFDKLLDEYTVEFPGLTVKFEELFSEDSARAMWRHLAGESSFPQTHWRKMRTLRVEQDERLIREAASGRGENVLPTGNDATDNSTILAQ